LCLNVVSLYAVVLFICYVYLYIVINYSQLTRPIVCHFVNNYMLMFAFLLSIQDIE